MNVLKLDVHETSLDELKGKCPNPNHQDNSPSWFINAQSGLHQCKSCGFKGNLESLSRILLGSERSERVLRACSGIDGNEDKYLQAKIHLALHGAPNEPEKEHDSETFQRFLEDLSNEPPLDPSIGSKVKPYLTQEIIDLYSLKHWTQHGPYYNRIVVPLKDLGGGIVNASFRAIHGSLIPKHQTLPSHVAKHKSDLVVFCNETLSTNKPTKYAFVVEGVYDAIYLGIHGYPACASFSSQISFSQMILINQLTQRPIILFDGDKSGQQGNIRSFHKFKRYLKLNFIRLFPGQDPDDITDFTFIDRKLKEIL